MMDFPHGVVVKVRSVTITKGSLGDTTETVIESSWGPCAVWDRYATERADPRIAPVIVGLMVAGPRRHIDSDDELIIGGATYAVDGLPETNTVSPFTGWDPGIVVPVKRVGGSDGR